MLHSLRHHPDPQQRFNRHKNPQILQLPSSSPVDHLEYHIPLPFRLQEQADTKGSGQIPWSDLGQEQQALREEETNA